MLTDLIAALSRRLDSAQKVRELLNTHDADLHFLNQSVLDSLRISTDERYPQHHRLSTVWDARRNLGVYACVTDTQLNAGAAVLGACSIINLHHRRLYWCDATDPANDMVAFYRDDAAYQADVLTKQRLGRVVAAVAPDCSSSAVRDAVNAMLAVRNASSLRLLDTAADIRSAYRNGPSSCMSHAPPRYTATWQHAPDWHPVEAYGGSPNMALAVIMDKDKCAARSVVNQETKRYNRVYGAGTLEPMLRRQGFTHGDMWDGAVLSLRETDDGRMLLGPYLDGLNHHGNVYAFKRPDGLFQLTHDEDLGTYRLGYSQSGCVGQPFVPQCVWCSDPSHRFAKDPNLNGWLCNRCAEIPRRPIWDLACSTYVEVPHTSPRAHTNQTWNVRYASPRAYERLGLPTGTPLLFNTASEYSTLASHYLTNAVGHIDLQNLDDTRTAITGAKYLADDVSQCQLTGCFIANGAMPSMFLGGAPLYVHGSLNFIHQPSAYAEYVIRLLAKMYVVGTRRTNEWVISHERRPGAKSVLHKLSRRNGRRVVFLRLDGQCLQLSCALQRHINDLP